MRAEQSSATAFDVVGEAAVRIEDVVDRDALEEMCRSIQSLFGIGVRIYSSQGGLLTNVGSELGICVLVNQVADGRAACGATVTAAKNVDPGEDGDVVHACFTGLAYRIVSLEYETRLVGRVVLGPFAPANLREPARSLTKMVPSLDMARATERLTTVARVKPEAIARIVRHLKNTLELIIFSSHKAYVTSKLHLHSVRESYRALEEKTKKLEEALARLKELDRLKSNFLGTVSHELRTPLTSIIGYSEMLEEGVVGSLSDEQAEFVGTIRSKGEQLLALIMGLLDLSKLDSGTMSVRQAAMEIGPTLDEVVSTLTPMALKKGVELELEVDRSPCELAGDAERLRQVFVNLVDNAVKFTPRGGKVSVSARIAVGTADDDEEGAVLLAPLQRTMEVTVADTGVGIPPAERSKVFDAFYQVDSSSTREHGGTGLGLSIVKRIVEAHGGTVTIRPNTPTGAVFVVVLPSAQARRASSARVPAR